MLYMKPFSVVKIKFKMQFCNLDDLGLSTLTYSNTCYVYFNFPSFILVSFSKFQSSFWSIWSTRSIFHISINLGRFITFEKFKSIGFPQFWLTSFHFGWFGVTSLDFAPYCLISIKWDFVT